MFTGLIRETAEVQSYLNHRLRLKSNYRPKIGDSIAVNGVCLTVVSLHNDGFSVEVADETRRIVPPEKFQGTVHIEPAMQLSDRFEGHIVQGHIDAIGTIERVIKGENAYEFYISVPAKTLAYIIPKGSIAIDGVSLTVNEVYESGFRLTIIPQTMQKTLFGRYKVGDKVNIETDLFARYIAHILAHKEQMKRSLSWEEIDAISLSY